MGLAYSGLVNLLLVGFSIVPLFYRDLDPGLRDKLGAIFAMFVGLGYVTCIDQIGYKRIKD